MSRFVWPRWPPGSEPARVFDAVSGLLSEPSLAALATRGWLAACSGGADSSALLLAVARACEASGARLEVACVDHGLRESAAGDVAHVADLCAALALPLHTRRLEWPDGARPGENELREARYAFFAQVMASRGLGGVLLGHTMDDQAETVLLHLIRGTGPRGLSGMGVVDGDRVRPLLSWRRDQLRAFLRACGVPWREDETNAQDGYLRNRVRHGLLEAMVRENPRAVEAVAQAAGLIRLEHDALVTLAEERLTGRAVRLRGQLESLRLDQLDGLPRGLRTLVLRRWWRTLSLAGAELRAEAVLEVIDRLGGSGEGTWDWPGPVRLVADRGLLVMSRPGLPVPGDLTVRAEPGLASPLVVEAVLAGPARLRFVRPGDRLWVNDAPGAGEVAGPVRCKKLLEGVPLGLRPFALVLTDAAERVVWLQYAGLCGVRLFQGDREIPGTV